MELAIDLARRGGSCVSPNPQVGCILVKNGDIIGQGYHREFGGPHAEVNALRDAVTDPIDATAYVTLEPCSIYGKTPPCTSALIKHGVAKVIIAMEDPNPKISGRGISALRGNGISVINGILEDIARELNKDYIRWITKGRPWVIAKAAVSSNNFLGIDRLSQTWITGEESRTAVHRIRAGVDAVMIGKNTAKVDNPSLTVRNVSGTNPIRVVVDTNCSLPLNLNLFRDQQAETIVLCSREAQAANQSSYCRYLPVEKQQEKLDPEKMLTALGRLGVTSLLIEGGELLLESFYEAGLIDEIYLFRSDKILNNAELHNPLQLTNDWEVKEVTQYGSDELTIAQKREIECLQE